MLRNLEFVTSALSLVYTEGGFNAPGGMSIDARGNLWRCNNFIPGSKSILFNASGPTPPGPIAYNGTGVTKFEMPWGSASDQQGRIWISNFGNNVDKAHNLSFTSRGQLIARGIL